MNKYLIVYNCEFSRPPKAPIKTSGLLQYLVGDKRYDSTNERGVRASVSRVREP